MPTRASEHVAGLEIRLAGQALAPEHADRLLEVRVRDHLMLPDTALVRVQDPDGELIDGGPLEIGAPLEVLLGGRAAQRVTSVFTGIVTAVEPEWGAHGVTAAVRAYDRSHRLTRERHSRTFQNQTSSDIVAKLAADAGLRAGTVEASGRPHDFVQQDNESDWDFAWRLAARHDFEFVVTDATFHFRRAGSASGEPVTLRWKENLRAFRPRASAAQPVTEVVVRGHEPRSPETVTATASDGATTSANGFHAGALASALGGARVVVADRPVHSQAEADALAQATLDRLTDTGLEAEGVAEGDPRIRAGVRLDVQGIGTRFGGRYTCSSSTHVYRGGRGYETHFTIAGRSPRTLIDLVAPRARRDWGAQLVVGVVTNTDDPDGLGRVRVRFPALSDEVEGWWARIATAAAGQARGMLMLPRPGDEVVVGFEHGDTRRPYVLGSVWNGAGKPGDGLVRADGSFSLASDEQVLVRAGEEIRLRTDSDFEVTAGGDTRHAGEGDVELTAGRSLRQRADQGVALEAGQSLTISSGTSLTIEAGASLTLKAAMIDIEASGAVSVKGSLINLG